MENNVTEDMEDVEERKKSKRIKEKVDKHQQQRFHKCLDQVLN